MVLANPGIEQPGGVNALRLKIGKISMPRLGRQHLQTEFVKLVAGEQNYSQSKVITSRWDLGSHGFVGRETVWKDHWVSSIPDDCSSFQMRNFSVAAAVSSAKRTRVYKQKHPLSSRPVLGFQNSANPRRSWMKHAKRAKSSAEILPLKRISKLSSITLNQTTGLSKGRFGVVHGHPACSFFSLEFSSLESKNHEKTT